MRIGHKDTDHQVVVVAEIGNNHEGSLEAALELVERAALAGADAVKFQTIVPELLVGPEQAGRLEQLRRLCLPWEAFPALRQAADDAGLIFLSTPFDLESARFLDPLVPAYKIASGDNDFFPLIEAVAAAGKPVLLSTGLCGLPQVRAAKTAIERIWDRDGYQGELALLHCVASYPTPPQEANLRAIGTLAGLGATPGYSDHTLGIEAAVLAVALGARVVEKHFTLDKNRSDFRDHQLSADPAELRLLVERIRQVELLVGQGQKTVMPCEGPALIAARRSAVAAVDLAEGETLAPERLLWLRPGGGIAPSQAAALYGKRLCRSVRRHERLEPSDFYQDF